MARRFERFVTVGDSTAEGVGDPDVAGGHRGFADRLASDLASHQGGIAYANLAVSGYVARQVVEQQLSPALAMRPDLVAIMAGMNNLLRSRFDARAIGDDIGEMQRRFIATGATVLSFTLPDVAHRFLPPPLHRPLSRRVDQLNSQIRQAAANSGALLIDLAAHSMASDPRMWSPDRLHANPDGHARIAAACAEALGLPGADGSWRDPLPPLPPTTLKTRVGEQLAWSRTYFAPWLWNRARRRPGVDQRVAKRPALAPVRSA